MFDDNRFLWKMLVEGGFGLLDVVDARRTVAQLMQRVDISETSIRETPRIDPISHLIERSTFP